MAEKFLDRAYEARDDQQTRDFYQRWAASYDNEVRDENGYQQPRRCAEALLALLPPARAGAVLDVGCGTGLAGAELAARGYRLLDGCDYAPAMLERAGLSGHYTRLFTADLNRPPMAAPDGHYAAATAVGIFSFGHVRAAAVDEILRVLRPGAPLVIGLNDHFYREGSLRSRLEQLDTAGAIALLGAVEGEHLPAHGLSGWVISARKAHQPQRV